MTSGSSDRNFRRGSTLMNVMIVSVLVVGLGAVSTKIIQYLNNAEKQSRISQSLLALQGNLTILFNTPSVYTNCVGGATPTCKISPATYNAVQASTGDPAVDILYHRILPFANCGGTPCGLRAKIVSPLSGASGTVVKLRVSYEGTDLPIKPRDFDLAIPEIAYRITNISCSPSEFFVGVDAKGLPVCTHFMSNCPAGQFFAGFAAPPAGQPYTADPVEVCQATAPATLPSANCPKGSTAVAQVGGAIGLYIKCILPSAAPADCPDGQIATQVSWNLSSRFAPSAVCLDRKGIK